MGTDLCILPIAIWVQICYNMGTESQTRLFANQIFLRRYTKMCMTKTELMEKIEEIRKYKAMQEEAANIQKSLEAEVIAYMNEKGITEEFTDNAKITYKPQSRTTLDKNKLIDILGEDLNPYMTVTSYNVLRIK